MRVLQEINIEFNRIIEDKKAKVNADIDVAVKNKLFFAKLITDKYKDDVYPNDILNYILNVSNNPIAHFNTDKVRVLFAMNDIRTILKTNLRLDISKEIFNIYNGFKDAVEKESIATLKLIDLENTNLNDRAFRYLYRKYFENVSYKLLETGHIYNFYRAGIYIKIKSKIRKGNKLKPDWGESLKLLKLLAENHNPELAKRYANKDITKQDFINEMKSITYNETTNPNGKKWIVYCNKDLDHWLIINRHHSTIKNSQYLHITPTNYIINETKSQVDFVKNAKSVKEIIYSGELGFRDKIRALENFDMAFCLNTYDNGN